MESATRWCSASTSTPSSVSLALGATTLASTSVPTGRKNTVRSSGQRDGWYLQLDIHNFFNSIHRPTLWSTLKARMQRRGLGDTVQRVTHALLRSDPLRSGVDLRATPAELAQVPPHKRLANAAPGCGLPIGNLSSQFFGNVYLDALDQFVKH